MAYKIRRCPNHRQGQGNAMGALLGARASVGASDGLSFIPVPEVEGMRLVAQEHGGALRAGGTPGNAGGGRAAHFGRA